MSKSLNTPFTHAPAAPSPTGENAINNENPCVPGHSTDAGIIPHKMFEKVEYNEAALNTPFKDSLAHSGIENPKKK